MTWNIGPCKRRSSKLEEIDKNDLTDVDLFRFYEFLGFVNKRFGGNRIVLNFFEERAKLWSHDRPISVLDVRCGRGDQALHLAKWAREKGADLRILAVDPNATIIRMAREMYADFHEVTFQVRDYTDPQFLQAQRFDYVISSLTLHRLTTEEAASLLKTANLLAKRGVIVCDWLRDVRAFLWMKSLVKFWGDEYIREDGPLAIKRGFTVGEAESLKNQAGLDYAQVRRHFGYRFSISGERGLVFSPKFAPVTGLAGT